MIPSLSLGKGIKKAVRRYDDDLPQWDNKRIVREIIRLQNRIAKLENKADDK